MAAYMEKCSLSLQGSVANRLPCCSSFVGGFFCLFRDFSLILAFLKFLFATNTDLIRKT